MRSRPTQAEVNQLFAVFGVDIVARLRACKTGPEVLAAWDAAKAEAKIEHRRLALEHHPDRGGDEEQLKRINAAWTQLQGINVKLTAAPQRKSALTVREARQGPVVSVFVGVSPFANTSTTTSTTAGSSYTVFTGGVRWTGW